MIHEAFPREEIPPFLSHELCNVLFRLACKKDTCKKDACKKRRPSLPAGSGWQRETYKYSAFPHVQDKTGSFHPKTFVSVNILFQGIMTRGQLRFQSDDPAPENPTPDLKWEEDQPSFLYSSRILLYIRLSFSTPVYLTIAASTPLSAMNFCSSSA